MFEGKNYYFLLASDTFWCDELFRIDLNENGTIATMVSCGGGLKETFSYDIIRMSQGAFITVYSASHMGNGTLEYYPLNGAGESSYSIFAIDRHYECMGGTALEYGLTKVYSDDISASTVYKNDRLVSTYDDVDGDGNTDITLTGTIQLYDDSVKDTKNSNNLFGTLVKEIPCEYICFYKEDSNSFELQE